MMLTMFSAQLWTCMRELGRMMPEWCWSKEVAMDEKTAEQTKEELQELQGLSQKIWSIPWVHRRQCPRLGFPLERQDFSYWNCQRTKAHSGADYIYVNPHVFHCDHAMMSIWNSYWKGAEEELSIYTADEGGFKSQKLQDGFQRRGEGYTS